MTVINPPAWLQAGEYPAHTDRLVTSSIVQTPGVVKIGDLAVTQNTTPGMSVMVSSGRAWIQDASAGGSANQGMYNFVNVGDVVLSVNTAHATNYRVDRVVARVEDSEISGSNNIASLVVLPGTAASTLPVAQANTPAVPAGAINRGTITVNPSATSITNANITQETATAKIYRDMYAPVVVTSSTRPTGLDRITGMRIYETDTGREWMWNGTAWLFRGGKGPKAYVSRPGQWEMPLTEDRLSSLEAESGSGFGGNFETSYYTFLEEATAGQGDRIKVKQAGLYTLEIYINMTNTADNYFALMKAQIASGSTGLPSYAVDMPEIAHTSPVGASKHFRSRTVYLPEGAEIAYVYDANKTGTMVNSFWASVTLIG